MFSITNVNIYIIFYLSGTNFQSTSTVEPIIEIKICKYANLEGNFIEIKESEEFRYSFVEWDYLEFRFIWNLSYCTNGRLSHDHTQLSQNHTQLYTQISQNQTKILKGFHSWAYFWRYVKVCVFWSLLISHTKTAERISMKFDTPIVFNLD